MEEEEGFQLPQAENAIQERELENIRSDVRNLLIKATLPFKEDPNNPHKDPEKVDPKFFKELGGIFKRAPWVIKWALGVILDLIFLTDEKSSPETAKEKLESVRYRRAFLSLQFLSFVIHRSSWARREITESVDTLRDITSYLPSLYHHIITYAFKKRVRTVQEAEMAHYWRCKLRFAIVEELNRWGEKWPDNKFLRLALQFTRKKGFKKGAILSGEEVLNPRRQQRRRPRAASSGAFIKRDPKFDEAAGMERISLEVMDSKRLEEHVRSILSKAKQSIVAIRECLDILFPPFDGSNAAIDIEPAAPVVAPSSDGNVEMDGDLFDESMLQEFAATENEMDQDFDDIQFDDDLETEEPAQAQSPTLENIDVKPDPALDRSEEESSLNKSFDSQRSVSLEFRLDASGNAVAVVRKDTNLSGVAASSSAAAAEILFDDAIQPVLDSLQEEFRAIERIYMNIYVARLIFMESDAPESLQMAQETLNILEDVDDVRVRCSVIGFIKPDSFVAIGGQILDAERGDAAEEEEETPSAPQLSLSDVDVDEKPPPAKRQKLTDGGIAAAAADAEKVRAEEDAIAGKVRRVRATKQEPKQEIGNNNPPIHGRLPPPAPPAASKKGRQATKPKSSPLQKLARKLGYKPPMSHGEKKSTNII